MISKSKKQETLSDKIAGILNTAPQSFDPEDDIYEETRAQVVENDEPTSDGDNDAVALSSFRKQNVDLLEDVDKKYAGKKGSRKSLRDSDEWETEDEGLSTDEGEALDGISGTREVADSDAEVSSENEEESVGDSDDDDESDGNYEDDVTETDSNFKHITDSNVTGQVRKGNCVRHQLNIWENVLETRIQLQKCLITSNKMPQHDVFANFAADKDFQAACTRTKQIITKTLNNFLKLQLLLLKQYPETKSLFKESKSTKKEEGSDEEIPSDSDAELKAEHEKESDEEEEEEKVPKKRRKLAEFEPEIKTRHDKYAEYRNSVIQKWHEKTRLMIAKNNTTSTSILQHINYVLDDRAKLVRRTQLKRSEYEVVGKIKTENPSSAESEVQIHSSKLPEEYDTEVYDDDDFYHQLLRELIEFKSSDVTDPVQMSRQWIALQKLRSKMKRKIDTKATKGRKIRYAVHSKLVNFMAPMDNASWTDEAKTELYASLFGNNQVRTSAT